MMLLRYDGTKQEQSTHRTPSHYGAGEEMRVFPGALGHRSKCVSGFVKCVSMASQWGVGEVSSRHVHIPVDPSKIHQQRRESI